ncbi:hypothetical protein SprV_0702326100 [Sparganum proliferum]
MCGPVFWLIRVAGRPSNPAGSLGDLNTYSANGYLSGETKSPPALDGLNARVETDYDAWAGVLGLHCPDVSNDHDVPLLRRKSPPPDQHFLPLSDAGEGKSYAPPITALEFAELCLPPEMRSAGRANDQGDLKRRLLTDQDGTPNAATQESTSNQMVHVDDLKSLVEAAFVETIWCQLQVSVQSTVLDVHGSGRRQYQDWFGTNDAAISRLCQLFHVPLQTSK